MQTTRYFCDRCKKEAGSLKNLHTVKLYISASGGRYEDFDRFPRDEMVIQWCRPCLIEIGVCSMFTKAEQESREHEKHSKPKLEDVIREIVQCIKKSL